MLVQEHNYSVAVNYTCA